MSILSILEKLMEIQVSLVVPAGTLDGQSENFYVDSAYPIIPPANAAVPPIFFANSYSLVSSTVMSGSLLETQWDVRMQLHVYDNDISRAALMATAFADKIVETFSVQNLTLGGVVSNTNLIGGTPTIGQSDAYRGVMAVVDFTLETHVKSVVTASP